jgi:hypothetical protein
MLDTEVLEETERVLAQQPVAIEALHDRQSLRGVALVEWNA